MVKESTSVRKKRKTQSGDGEAETDIYKRVCQFEEKEVSSRDQSADAQIYIDTCLEIQNLVDQTRDFMQHQEGESFDKRMDFLSQLLVKICVIKKLNRMDKLNQVAGRATLNVQKQTCDSIKLNYQNLVYELHHLVAEIQKCLSFKSDDELIELVSLEDFMEKAPEEITSKFKDCDKNNPDQQHALWLARLEWELTQRKNLAEECQVLKEKKKNMMATITEKHEKLNSILPLLNAVIKTTQPLQEHLGMPLDQTRKEHKLAKLLPEPLYILYANMVAYNTVNETNFSVVIKGNKDEALQWKEAQDLASESSVVEDDDTSEQELEQQENEEVVEVKKRRHRKSTQQADPVEEKKKKLLDVHPLTIELSLPYKEGPTLNITLAYYNKLRMIAVNSKTDISNKITANTARDILCGENLLNELFENDTGLVSPNPSVVYQLQKVGINSFESLIKEIGFAYRWAQSICGIDHLPTKFSEQLSQQSVEAVLKILQERLATRTVLARQMQDLENNTLPKIPEKLLDPALNPVSTISKWTSVSYQTFCEQEYTKSLVEDEFVSSTDMFYSVLVTRGSATLKAFIVIKNSYPVPAPIFVLCLDYNKQKFHSGNIDDIRDIERVLNVDWNQNLSNSPWLLSVQLAHLCTYFDVYLEIEDPKVFPGNSKFLKAVRTFLGERTGFVQVGPKKWFFPSGYLQEAENFYNFEVRPDDVFIVTFPRSGTTWAQEMIWMLCNDLDYEKSAAIPLVYRFPFLEWNMFVHKETKKEFLQENQHDPNKYQVVENVDTPVWQILSKTKERRFIKTHLPFSLLPPDLLKIGCKVIYLARNPKDVAVSYYHLNRTFRTQGYNGDFKRYYDYFERNLQAWAPYWEHIKEAWSKRHDKNLLFMFYEDMNKNLRRGIEKVAEFLEKSYTNKELDKLENHLKFENFKNNKSVNFNILSEVGILLQGEAAFVRQGKTGGWKEYFDKEMEERADNWIKENLKDTDIVFPL